MDLKFLNRTDANIFHCCSVRLLSAQNQRVAYKLASQEYLGCARDQPMPGPHEDPQATFFCDQRDFLVATDALFSKGDKRISCCGNLISTLISGQKT